MSLIEEALRKQREEQAPQATPEPPTKLSLSSAATPPPPPIPPASADEPKAEEAPAPRQAWPLLAGILGIGVVLVVAIALLLFFGVKAWRAKPAVKPVAAAATASTKAAPKSSPSRINTPSAPTGAVPSASSPAQPVTRVTTEAALPPADTNPAPLAPTVAVAAEPAVVAAPPSASAAPVATATVSPSGAVTDNVPATATTVPPPAQAQAPVKTSDVSASVTPMPEEKKSLVPWPRLTVTGLIGSARGKGAAIINGQTVGPGNTIEGVKIIAVEKQGVRVSFGGETRVLPAGSTTE